MGLHSLVNAVHVSVCDHSQVTLLLFVSKIPSFCLYMEAGPCCDVFLAWEAVGGEVVRLTLATTKKYKYICCVTYLLCERTRFRDKFSALLHAVLAQVRRRPGFVREMRSTYDYA